MSLLSNLHDDMHSTKWHITLWLKFIGIIIIIIIHLSCWICTAKAFLYVMLPILLLLDVILTIWSAKENPPKLVIQNNSPAILWIRYLCRPEKKQFYLCFPMSGIRLLKQVEMAAIAWLWHISKVWVWSLYCCRWLI